MERKVSAVVIVSRLHRGNSRRKLERFAEKFTNQEFLAYFRDYFREVNRASAFARADKIENLSRRRMFLRRMLDILKRIN